MRRLLSALSSALCVVAVSAASAAAGPPQPSRSADLQLAVNGPWARAEFDAKHLDRSFGFLAAAGDSISIEIDSTTFADACALDLRVLDGADRVVAQQTCASGRGRATTMNLQPRVHTGCS